MTLQHALYGSATGLGDFKILASSSRLDERTWAMIRHYGNLEGSAMSAPFQPIFSFYALGNATWAFTRTFWLDRSSRGSDYLVHAIVLDELALARIDYRPFALADSGLFISQKLAAGTVLEPLRLDNVIPGIRPFAVDNAGVGSALRTVAHGPVRLRVADESENLCREIHESLPPSDRLFLTFCTRYSYFRQLDLRLAAFAAEDEAKVRESAGSAVVTNFPLTWNGAADVFERWATDIRGRADFDLVGLSILREPREAFVLVDELKNLRSWAKNETRRKVTDFEKAAALILLKPNRTRAGAYGLISAALAVVITSRVREGKNFDDCVRLAAEFDRPTRTDGVQRLRFLETTQAVAWMAEMILLLIDAPLDVIADALQRAERGRALLTILFSENPDAYRAFVTTLLARMRDRFDAAGASVAATAAALLGGERDALSRFVLAMEEAAAADADRARQTDWLFAIVRDVFPNVTMAPGIPARIVLTYRLLAFLDELELETLAPRFFAMEEIFANALDAAPASENPTLYRVLARVAAAKLREPWSPRTSAGVRVVQRILTGASHALDWKTALHLTTVAFLSATAFAQPIRTALRAEVAEAVERIARIGLDPVQGALLARAVQRLARESGIRVRRKTLARIWVAAKARPARKLLNRVALHLRMRALSEGAA